MNTHNYDAFTLNILISAVFLVMSKLHIGISQSQSDMVMICGQT